MRQRGDGVKVGTCGVGHGEEIAIATAGTPKAYLHAHATLVAGGRSLG